MKKIVQTAGRTQLGESVSVVYWMLSAWAIV